MRPLQSFWTIQHRSGQQQDVRKRNNTARNWTDAPCRPPSPQMNLESDALPLLIASIIMRT